MKVDVLIIDADSLAFKANSDTYEYSVVRFIEKVNTIRQKFSYKSELFLLTFGRNNFRYSLDKDYKASRVLKEYPEFVMGVKNFMVDNLGALKFDHYEADDAAAIFAKLCRDRNLTYVIVHIDSDLNQIEGWHYNYDKDSLYYLSDAEANKIVLRDILLGTHNGAKGLPGFGRVTYEKLAKKINTIFEVEQIYKKGIPKSKGQREVKGLGDAYWDYFSQQTGLCTLCQDLFDDVETQKLSNIIDVKM
ncbi:hypothetical protein, partial [Romboutsia sp.]|uniref:hypothetical protein n=1 Tax=Romboutsia sp. TaxID=1965302 RepID=UPI003F39EDF2